MYYGTTENKIIDFIKVQSDSDESIILNVQDFDSMSEEELSEHNLVKVTMAVPFEGKYITDSHVEYADGLATEIIDQEMTYEELLDRKKTNSQIYKSQKLKQAENEYLTLLSGLPITITPGENSDTITQKLTDSGMAELEAVKTGVKLLNAIHEVELKGGSWYNLPDQLHNL